MENSTCIAFAAVLLFVRRFVFFRRAVPPGARHAITSSTAFSFAVVVVRNSFMFHVKRDLRCATRCAALPLFVFNFLFLFVLVLSKQLPTTRLVARSTEVFQKEVRHSALALATETPKASASVCERGRLVSSQCSFFFFDFCYLFLLLCCPFLLCGLRLAAASRFSRRSRRLPY